MTRTAGSSVKVSGGKTSKKGGSSSNSTSSKSTKSSGSFSSKKGSWSTGNQACSRETPAWQKPITNFMTKVDKITDESSSNICNDSANKENVSDNSFKNIGDGSQGDVEKTDERAPCSSECISSRNTTGKEIDEEIS